MYRIPRIDCNVACPASLEEAFARTVRETVACNNWPADFPYAPQVGFRIFHTGADLLLRFDFSCSVQRKLFSHLSHRIHPQEGYTSIRPVSLQINTHQRR